MREVLYQLCEALVLLYGFRFECNKSLKSVSKTGLHRVDTYSHVPILLCISVIARKSQNQLHETELYVQESGEED